jgi:predicted nucleotidyltransferase
MPNLIDVVVKLAGVFDRLQLRFALGGALANNYWGIVRTTQDVDCLFALPRIKYQLFADELNAIGCTVQDEAGENVPVTVPHLTQQVEQRKLIECCHETVRIELFVPAVPLQEEVLRRAVPIRLSGRDVPVTTAEDLILLKLAFHRAKDLQDVRGILWVQRGRLDLDYMRQWSERTHEPDTQSELVRLIAEYSESEADDRS